MLDGLGKLLVQLRPETHLHAEMAAIITPAAPTGFGVIGPGAILDHFEEGLRSYGANPRLWDCYKGEAGTSQLATIAVDSVRPKVGTKSLHYANPGDGRSYFHFYCNNGSIWDFAHQQLVQGAWNLNSWNRMAFWVWHDPGMTPIGNNGHLVELGTYTRANNGDATTQNAGGTHWYHELNPRDGVWTKVILDPHPQHYVGGPTTDPGVVGITGGVPLAATNDGVSNYFDALTRWYYDFPYVPKAGSIFVDQVTLYLETGQDDIAHIASLEASWNPTTHLLHVGFCRNAHQDTTADTTYTAVYSTVAPINALGFAGGTIFGSVGPDGLGDYCNKAIEGVVDLTGVQTVYLAVQKKGSTAFRQMSLPINAAGI